MTTWTRRCVRCKTEYQTDGKTLRNYCEACGEAAKLIHEYELALNRFRLRFRIDPEIIMKRIIKIHQKAEDCVAYDLENNPDLVQQWRDAANEDWECDAETFFMFLDHYCFLKNEQKIVDGLMTAYFHKAIKELDEDYKKKELKRLEPICNRLIKQVDFAIGQVSNTDALEEFRNELIGLIQKKQTEPWPPPIAWDDSEIHLEFLSKFIVCNSFTNLSYFSKFTHERCSVTRTRFLNENVIQPAPLEVKLSYEFSLQELQKIATKYQLSKSGTKSEISIRLANSEQKEKNEKLIKSKDLFCCTPYGLEIANEYVQNRKSLLVATLHELGRLIDQDQMKEAVKLWRTRSKISLDLYSLFSSMNKSDVPNFELLLRRHDADFVSIVNSSLESIKYETIMHLFFKRFEWDNTIENRYGYTRLVVFSLSNYII